MKVELRQSILGKLKDFSPKFRAEASARISEIILNNSVWAHAKAVMLYSPIGHEADITSVILNGLADGKMVALPVFVEAIGEYAPAKIERLEACGSGKYGILEPGPEAELIPLNALDLVLVPGVGFDLMGHRLGRGKGYYDRLLSQVHGIKCGVAYEEQLVSQIPVEPHDVPMNCIVTPTRWHDCQ